MSKKLLSLGVGGALALGVGFAQAATIQSYLVPGTLNTALDESREAFVDNGDGIIGAGDVIFGYVKISNFQTSSTSVSTNNDVYAIFSQQIDSVSGTVINFTTTTVSGLTLADLTGDTNATGGLFALYDANASSYSVDLINNSPAGATEMQDYLDFISTNGTLEVVGGLSDTGDYLASVSGLAGAPTSGISCATTDPKTGACIPLQFSQTIASTAGATSTLYNQTNFDFADLVPVIGPPPLINATNAEIAISSGTVAGSGGAAPAGQAWLNAGTLPTGYMQCDGDPTTPGIQSVPCGFTDKNNFQVIPTAVPEPGSLALIGLALMGAVGVGMRRKQQ